MSFTINFKCKKNASEEYPKVLLISILILSFIGLLQVLKFIIEYIDQIFAFGNYEAQVSFLQLIATIIAGTWALALFYRKNKTDKNKFLKIFLETRIEKNQIIISTKLINETDNVRKMEMAFLIITLAHNTQIELGENPISLNIKQEIQDVNELQIEDIHYYLKKINNYLGTSFTSSEHLKDLKKFNSFNSEDKDLLFIQLPYYTKENIQISNEELTFEYTFLQNELENGIYDVRFFVFPTNDEFPNLERIVHKSLIIKN